MNNILENIDRMRRDKGYSQEYIASKIGMKQAGFSLIMSGDRELKYNTLLQIANVFQVKVIDVITYPVVYRPEGKEKTSTDTILQIKLDGRKREEVLKIVLGHQALNFLDEE